MKKDEILRGKTKIDILFNNGKGFINYPLRCVYAYSLDDGVDKDFSALFVVGKRYHKRAVKRNLVRRRIKEAYRLQLTEFKSSLLDMGVSSINIAFIYIGKEESDYFTISEAVTKILSNVTARIKKNIDSTIHITD